MGVELAVAVENRFGTRLPVMAMSDNPTISKLAIWIIAHLKGDGAAPSEAHDDTRRQIALVAAQHDVDAAPGEILRIAENLSAGPAAPNRRMIH
jgi:hypothetical protein